MLSFMLILKPHIHNLYVYVMYNLINSLMYSLINNIICTVVYINLQYITIQEDHIILFVVDSDNSHKS